MNLARLIEDNITRFGKDEFLHFSGRWYTNVDMNTTANRLGNALKSLGIKRGDRVGVQLLNCPQLIQSFFASFKIGATLVSVNPQLRADELAYIYHDSGMRALISSPDGMDRIREARKEAPDLKNIILIGDEVQDDAISYEKIVKQTSDELVTADTD